VQIWTNAFGEILLLSGAAEKVMGYTRKCRGMSITLLFDGNREAVTRALDGVARGRVETLEARLRPKETRPLSVSVVAKVDDDRPELVCWTFAQQPVTKMPNECRARLHDGT
jgi:hypothetical protein